MALLTYMRQHTSAYGSTRGHMTLLTYTRQHTSAYGSIRQHAYTYLERYIPIRVSIRQHTAAYVSMRIHIYSVYNPPHRFLLLSRVRASIRRPTRRALCMRRSLCIRRSLCMYA